LSPIVVIIFIVTIFLLKLIYKNSLIVSEENRKKILEFDERKAINDRVLLMKSFAVLGLTILGFTTHQIIGLESATVALFGGSLLLLISKVEPEDILIEIEWTTIFFFIGLFVLVGALEEVGVVEILAKKMLNFTKGDLFMTAMLILWMAAIASAFIDNIPFVATMIPLIKSLSMISGIDVTPLWWALSLGACLGGNGTLVGASANVIVGGMLEKNKNKLAFLEYMKIGFPLMIISIIIASIYLIIFYV
jgi:Na+/H+ antiporter NhaD/arsenite permease-like protein